MKTFVMFVGSNPSNASATDAAFHGATKSSKILTEWTKNIPYKAHCNVIDKKTEGNRPLTTEEVKAGLEDLRWKLTGSTHIVALGKTASKALSLLNVPFYEMPHPSGRNRLLNDPKYVEGKVKGLENYCSQGLPQITSESES